MRKTYVIDTCVIATDPNCFYAFEDCNIILPVAVLEELDGLKSKHDTAGVMARRAVKALDKMFENASPQIGANLGEGTILKIDISNIRSDKFNCGNKDDLILSCAASYENCTLVTRDINLKLRAKAAGLKAIGYEGSSSIDNLYTGVNEIDFTDCDPEFVPSFTNNGLDDVTGTCFEELYPNEFIKVLQGDKTSIYRRVGNRLKPLSIPKDVFGIKSRSAEQAMCLELLLDPNISCVSIIGKAGCGKSLLTLASALEQVINQKIYETTNIYRPIVSVSQELGYLPGNVQEKIAPYMTAVNDQLKILLPASHRTFIENCKGKVNFDALAYIRGRSINNCFIILDEAQNLNKNELKTVLTRLGTGSKIIINGDIEQIDKINLVNSNDNGLSYVVDALKTSHLTGHITLQKTERSAFAEEAVRLL